MNASVKARARKGWKAMVAGGVGSVLLGLLGAGCSPSTFLARRMMDAPNRVPEFVKPEGRVWLGWPEGVFERFPTGTNTVGHPAVGLRWVVVEPSDYGWERRESMESHRGQMLAKFRFEVRLPPEGLPAPKPVRGTAYLLHGYGVDLETLFPWAVFLAEAGWRSVLVDLPGHGHSTGRQVTFGIREVELLKEFRNTVGVAKGWGGPTVVVGHSMGAALALRWQATDDGIAGSVALGPYSEFVPAVLRLRDDYATWVPRGWVRHAAAKVPRILGVPPNRLDTLAAIRGKGLRALLIASANDVVTPPEDSAALRAELGEGSEFLIVGEASHETLPFVFPQHGKKVRRWLEDIASGTRRATHIAGSP